MILTITALLASQAAFVAPSSTDPVQAVYRKLNGGATISPTSPLYLKMKEKWDTGDRAGAGEMATHTNSFYELTVLQFASKLLSLDTDPFVALNDFQADVFGVIRDRLDFRTLLTGDFRYVDSRQREDSVSRGDNDHFDQAVAAGGRLTQILKREDLQWNDTGMTGQAAGLLTTRGFAQKYLSAGTNRRAVIGSFTMFLCSPIAEWRDASLPDDRIRRDIERVPGGNALTFQTECRGCHAPMDGMVSAFNEWDFTNDTVSYLGDHVMAAKVNQNSSFYPDGYVSEDNSFMNRTGTHQQSYFQWGTKVNGKGPRDFGEMIAESGRFPTCMVKRVFEHLCRKSATQYPNEMKEWTTHLKDKNFDLLTTFAEVASSDACLN